MKTIRNYILIPIPGTGDTYDVPKSECSTKKQVEQWIIHIGEKRWATSKMMEEFREIAMRCVKP